MDYNKINKTNKSNKSNKSNKHNKHNKSNKLNKQKKYNTRQNNFFKNIIKMNLNKYRLLIHNLFKKFLCKKFS